MGGGLESRCVGRVYGADGAVRFCYPKPQSGLERFALSATFNVSGQNLTH